MRKAFSGFAWDDANRQKCQRHGVSLSEVEHVLAHGETLIIPDLKSSQDEQRFLAIGRTQTARYAFVVFTPRQSGDSMLLRPISARYVHRREVRRYEKEIARAQKR